MARLPPVRALHPAVAHALGQLHRLPVHQVVAQSGYSHRGFIALFRDAVGLSPKRYARVQRFRRVLQRTAADPAVSWIDLALDAGYSDQSHFNREFQEFAGVSPAHYRRARPMSAHHLPLAKGQFSSRPARADAL